MCIKQLSFLPVLYSYGKIKWKNSIYKNYKRNRKKAEDYELLTKTVSEVS